MRIFQFVIAAAAVAWPTIMVAQGGAGLGGTAGGTGLGSAPEKGSVSLPEPAAPLAASSMAGTDPKTAEPGIVAMPEPEVAETPGAGGAVQPEAGLPDVAEDATGAASAPGAGLARDTADGAVETPAIAPEPEAEAPEPVPAVEVAGADPAQVPLQAVPDPDAVVASAELGGRVLPDADGPGEEFVRISREDTGRGLASPSHAELGEAMTRAALSLAPVLESVAGDVAAFELVVPLAPGLHEEPREAEIRTVARIVGLSVAVADLMPGTPLHAPDLAFAGIGEERMSREETAVLAALADDPQADFEEKTMTDPNQIVCLDALGAPDAGVPVSKTAQSARLERLAGVSEACQAAAEGMRPAPEVLFFAGEIAMAKRDYAAAFALFEQAAGGGVGPADTRLADFYLFGAQPVTRDIAKAVELLDKGAALGDPAAMTSLAMLYRAGSGVGQDSTRMVDLLKEAAEAGYHFAQYRLAQTYLNGDGIPGRADPALGIPDPVRAAEWFTRAAEAGNVEAALELAGLYGDPASGLPENPGEQARLTQMVADTGHPAAIAAMGVLFETGRGVVQSPEQAAAAYIAAMESGEVAFQDLRRGAPFDWNYDTARAFQEALALRGVYEGAIDGVVGAGTRRAAERLAGG
ncbi:MAG: hypothetical protein CSA74_08740 [Rhodobacterales bacterium]|nr:MAG: hypothetical protein CSA74_08740 [Rhodobacterales bacterium]